MLSEGLMSVKRTTDLSVYVCMYVCVYVYVCMCVCIYMYVCVCIYMYIRM
jgi:hypothetical protein